MLAFQKQHKEYFFGRDRYVEGLLTVVRQQPLVALIGASGSGKSSVVFAGLIPQLRETGIWLIESFRPENKPFYNLASALVSQLEPELGNIAHVERAKALTKSIQQDGFTEFVSKILKDKPGKHLLIYIDQFEELYTLCEDAQEQQRFVDAILEAIQSAPNRLTVVFTLRADFVSYVLNYAPFGEALQQHKLQILSAMNQEEMKTAIEQPAKKMSVTLEEGLTERILGDVKQEPGNLPLLEFTLTQLWAKRSGSQLTHQAYEEIGGVAKALANHAEAVYEELSEKDKIRAERVFIQLVRPGEGTEDTRCIATREAVGGNNWNFVTRLASSRLVVTGRDQKKEAETVEVVHEALIREWKRLQRWVNDSRSFRIWQVRLKGRMEEWKAKDRDEGALLRSLSLTEAKDWLSKRKEELSDAQTQFIQESQALRDKEKREEERRRKEKIRLQRRINIGLASFSVIALGLAGVAGVGWRNAEINEINALIQSSDGLLNTDQPAALQSSIKAAVKIQGKPWVDTDTRTTVELALLNTVHNVVAPNALGGGHANLVYNVSFALSAGGANSPDGKLLASASADKTVKLWDTSTGKIIKTFKGHTNSVFGVSFSPDGKLLASASADRTVKLWNASTGKVIKTLQGHKAAVSGVSFSPDGKFLISTSFDATVKLWDTTTYKEIKTFKGHTNSVNGVSLSPDGKLLASASSDRTVKLWDTSTGKVIKTFKEHKAPVTRVRFSPDGKSLASASVDRTVKLWDTSTGKVIKTLQEHKAPVSGVSFAPSAGGANSPDGKLLASASNDGTVKLWNITTGKVIKTLQGHKAPLGDVSFSPNGKFLASASADRTVKLWDTSTGKVIKTLPLQGHKAAVNVVSFSLNGKFLASASVDRTVKLWDASTGKLIKTFKEHKNSVRGVSFSPNGKFLASASADRTVKLWDTSTGKLINTFKKHKAPVFGVSFSPDGKLLASSSDDGTVKLWNITTGKVIKTLNGNRYSSWGISFSPDSKLFASASTDNTVKLWDTSTYKEIKTFQGHKAPVRGVSFSPDGKLLASASIDRTVKLWDVTTGKVIKTLQGHKTPVEDFSFSPNSKLLASTSADRTVKLWDTSTGKVIKTLQGHKAPVRGVSFSPDGKLLAFASADKTVKLWRRDFDYLLKEGCNFMREYFRTNPPDNEEDKHLCDGVSRKAKNLEEMG